MLIPDDFQDDPRYFYDWSKHSSAAKQKTGFWTEEKEDELRRLWTSPLQAKEIGSRLGCTKNAVIGKANRIGLEPRDPEQFICPVQRRKACAKGRRVRRANYLARQKAKLAA